MPLVNTICPDPQNRTLHQPQNPSPGPHQGRIRRLPAHTSEQAAFSGVGGEGKGQLMVDFRRASVGYS